MKKERVHVTSEMRDRFKAEMKAHKQNGYQVAELLNVEPGTYSRYLRGEIDLSQERLQKLAELWGVRTEYLLCKDDTRTIEEYFKRDDVDITERQRHIWETMTKYGYEFEYLYEHQEPIIKITRGGICYGCIGPTDFVRVLDFLEVSMQTMFENILYANRFAMYRKGAVEPLRKAPYNYTTENSISIKFEI